MIRFAAEKDISSLVRLMKEAHRFAQLPFPFSAPHAFNIAQSHIQNDGLLALVCTADDDSSPQGLLLASTQMHPFSPVKYAAEVMWYIRPIYRGRHAISMMKAYEAWAYKHNCSFVGMAGLTAFPRIKILYQRLGYSEVETHFIKTFTVA